MADAMGVPLVGATTGSLDADIFVARFDDVGRLLDVPTFGTPGPEYAYDGAIGSDGLVLLAGAYAGPGFDLGFGPLPFRDSYDAFVVRRTFP